MRLSMANGSNSMWVFVCYCWLIRFNVRFVCYCCYTGNMGYPYNDKWAVLNRMVASVMTIGVNGLMVMFHMSHLSYSANEMVYLHFHFLLCLVCCTGIMSMWYLCHVSISAGDSPFWHVLCDYLVCFTVQCLMSCCILRGSITIFILCDHSFNFCVIGPNTLARLLAFVLSVLVCLTSL